MGHASGGRWTDENEAQAKTTRSGPSNGLIRFRNWGPRRPRPADVRVVLLPERGAITSMRHELPLGPPHPLMRTFQRPRRHDFPRQEVPGRRSGWYFQMTIMSNTVLGIFRLTRSYTAADAKLQPAGSQCRSIGDRAWNHRQQCNSAEIHPDDEDAFDAFSN